MRAPNVDYLVYQVYLCARNMPRGRFFISYTPHSLLHPNSDGMSNLLGSPGIDYYILYNMKLPFSDGSLGSRNDEERRETRYVM